MQKPDSLRSALVTAIPELARDPDKLKLFIDRGQIQTLATGSLAFAWSYTLNLIVEDWTGHPDLIVIAVIIWLRDNQIELVARHDEGKSGFRFEADIIDANTIDLSIELDLLEPVGAIKREDGGYDLTHFAQPAPVIPDEVALVTSPGNSAVTLAELWLDGEKLIPG